MVSKTIKIFLAFMALIQTVSFAQSTDDSWVFDSSKISSKNMPQHNEFVNYQTPYPAKPRNQIELGFSGGFNKIIAGDVFGTSGFGGGISLRKALGHVISLRGAWNGSFNYGLDGNTSRYDAGNNFSPWNIYNNNPQAGKYVLNYKNATHMLALEMIASLNNMSHYRGNPKWDWYVFLGPSAWSADVDVDAVNDNNQPYNFSSIVFDGTNGKDNRNKAKNILDGKYESNASYASQDRTNSYSRIGENQLIGIGLNYGMGLAFKINDRFNIGLEQKFTSSFSDYLDGVSSATANNSGVANDAWSATHLRLNVNLGSSSKSIQPLWWVNPNNYVYNELNSPKHLKMPPVVLPDADGDGVTDQFDMEANTPAGCPVDSHGVTKDTDGDGVPDCRDKEILTQQSCFPVNADGVGTCPDPACCKNIAPPDPACNISSLPSISFKSGSASLSSTAKTILNSVAAQLNANPLCNVKVIGYGASDKRSQQLSWDHVNAVIKYLTESQGISESRFIFSNGNPGDASTVDLQATTETGPNTATPPFPQYKKTN